MTRLRRQLREVRRRPRKLLYRPIIFHSFARHNSLSGTDLRREDARDRFADFRAMNSVEGQCELRLHQPVRDAGVVALAVDDGDEVAAAAVLAEVLLGGGELEL